jgi:hypothetical protein
MRIRRGIQFRVRIPHQRVGAISHSRVGAISHQREGAIPHQRVGAIPHQRVGAIPHQRVGAIPHQREGPSRTVACPSPSIAVPVLAIVLTLRKGKGRRYSRKIIEAHIRRMCVS